MDEIWTWFAPYIGGGYWRFKFGVGPTGGPQDPKMESIKRRVCEWESLLLVFTQQKCIRWLCVTWLKSAVNEILSTKCEVALKITHNLLHWPSYICQSIQTKMKLQKFVDFNTWAKFQLHLPSYIWQSIWTYGTVIKILISFCLFHPSLKIMLYMFYNLKSFRLKQTV